MANFAVNEIWEMRVVCNTASQISINSFHYRVTQATNPVDSSYANNQLDTTLAPLYKAVMPITAQYYGVSFQRAYPLPRTLPTVSHGTSGAGTALGDLLPKQTAGIISCHADAAGREFRGRCYIPFPSEDHSDANGLPTAAYMLLLNSINNVVYTPLTITVGGNTNVLTPVIYHRAGPSNSSTVTGSIVRGYWGSQRRRGDFGATNKLPF